MLRKRSKEMRTLLVEVVIVNVRDNTPFSYLIPSKVFWFQRSQVDQLIVDRNIYRDKVQGVDHFSKVFWITIFHQPTRVLSGYQTPAK